MNPYLIYWVNKQMEKSQREQLFIIGKSLLEKIKQEVNSDRDVNSNSTDLKAKGHLLTLENLENVDDF